ncbi:MAG TPA: Asd/ArgC dimerization domain-containing protein [Candidatus Sulfotelmatobacter sp.]
MSSPTNPAVAHTSSRGILYRAAIVGAASLKGKEVAEMLNERNFPAVDVRLLDDDESLGQLEAMGDEISFIQAVRSEQFENVDFTFFAADMASTRANWNRARDGGSAIIDLSAALEDEPGAAVRSVWVERERGQVPPVELQPGPCVTAHPAAVVLALVLLRAKKVGAVRRAAVTVFEPASERGQKGMDELHQQTVNLLSFQPLPKDIYDAQVAFNMIARYGPRVQPALDSIEARVVRHYLKIAGNDALTPSVLLLQAPIFHGYAIAISLEMGHSTDLTALREALAGDHITISGVEPGSEEDGPSNVSAAGQPDILLSVRQDPSQPNSFWLWAAADNLRISAISAVECAESMTATRPVGKIQ